MYCDPTPPQWLAAALDLKVPAQWLMYCDRPCVRLGRAARG
jgi:hypothetical protein